MSYYPDEEPDPLTIANRPAPTGAVIQRAQVAQAPQTAPVPTTEVDAYARSAPSIDRQEAQTHPEAPDVSQLAASKQVAENYDAYARQDVPEPVIMHRRATDDREEA